MADDNKRSMWDEIQTGYLRKIGEDAASRSNNTKAGPGVLVFIALWIIGSTWFVFAAGEPGPFLVVDALLVFCVIKGWFLS